MNDVEKTKEQLFSQKSAGDRFSDVLRGRFGDLRFRREGGEFFREVSELGDFLAQHVAAVGAERAIQDFQTGLNLLNGYKKASIIESIVELAEDGDFGEKSYAALVSVLKHYPVEVIKAYVKKGALSNIVLSTKDNSEVDTDREVFELQSRLK